MKVVLPDNTELELPEGATGRDARGRDRGRSRAGRAGDPGRRASCGTSRRPLADGERVEVVTPSSAGALDLIRHDAAHVMATAVGELYPGTKMSIGPPIENGFYYDFEFPEGVKVSDEDLAAIEEKMRAHVEADEPFERSELPVDEAERYFADQDQDYKVELIRDLVSRRRSAVGVAVPQRSVHGSLSRSARSINRADQGFQAAVARRRLLARRRAQPDADAHLRHGLLLEEGSRAAPRAARAGARS